MSWLEWKNNLFLSSSLAFTEDENEFYQKMIFLENNTASELRDNDRFRVVTCDKEELYELVEDVLYTVKIILQASRDLIARKWSCTESNHMIS